MPLSAVQLATLKTDQAAVTKAVTNKKNAKLVAKVTGDIDGLVADPPPAPAVTGIGPSSSTAPGGTTVTIAGSNLAGATAVGFGTTPAASFTVNANGTITAVSPDLPVGEYDIRVTTAGGISPVTVADVFTYAETPPPPPPPPPPPAEGLPWQAGSTTGPALGFPASPQPNHLVRIRTANAFNIFTPGTPITFQLNQAGATNYEIDDAITGAVISTGTVSGTSLTPPVPTTQGTYRVRLMGPTVDPVYGNAYGDCSFIILPVDPNYPALDPVPGYVMVNDAALPGGFVVNDPPSSLGGTPNPAVFPGNGSGGSANYTLAALCDTPYRLNFPALPTGSTPAQGVEWYQSLANGYLANLKADAINGWTSIKPDGRVRQFTCAFPSFAGGAAEVAGLTAAVEILGSQVAWEATNEPNNNYSPASYLPIHTAFYNAVKAGNPSAPVIGPGTVTINNASLGWIGQFLALKPGLDGISFHPYNSFGGNSALGDKCMTALIALLTTYGYAGLPRYSTETGGDLMADYGPAFIRRQFSNSIRRMWQMVRYGVPQPNQDYFYPCSHGFWAQPSWLSNSQIGVGSGGNDPNPLCLGLYVATRISRNMDFVSEQSLGGAADFMKAYNFTGSGGTLTVLFSTGQAELGVTVSSTSTMTAVDVNGNPVAITAGQLTVTDLPVYVTSATAITVTDVEQGLMTAVDIMPTMAGTPTAAAGMSTANLATLVDGSPPRSSYFDNQDEDGNSPYTDTNNVLPATLAFPLDQSETIKRLAYIGTPPWHQGTALLEWSIEAEVNGAWETVYTYPGNPTATSIPFASNGTGCTRETFYNCEWMKHILLEAPVSGTGFQLVVTETTWGDAPDIGTATQCSGSQGCPQRTVVSGLRAYTS